MKDTNNAENTSGNSVLQTGVQLFSFTESELLFNVLTAANNWYSWVDFKLMNQ
jgi:hypothetical protein